MPGQLAGTESPRGAPFVCAACRVQFRRFRKRAQIRDDDGRIYQLGAQ